MLYAHEVVVNELAQGLRPVAEGVEWFEGLAEEDRRKVLHTLVLFCGQARACEADTPEAIARSGIRPTHTPAVMLTKWRFGMEELPAYELTKSFRLLVALFTIADTRRRERYCADGCGHAWHNLRTPAAGAVESHVRAYFEGHDVEAVDYGLGPVGRAVVPRLRVLVVAPGPRSDRWAYVTVGCWDGTERDGRGLEFVMTAHVRDRRFTELMVMIASYHCGGHQLDLEHSLPIGEPWVPGSTCEHLLISLPYLHGPDLEHCPVPGGHARILWALPVTTAEIEFRRAHGHEALEQLFDEAAIDPTDPFRASVA